MSASGSMLGKFAEEHKSLLLELAEFDPVKTAATFGALLLFPELQSNCLRIETLTHFALSVGASKRKPLEPLIERAFRDLGEGMCGRLEDPAEDLFVGLVRTSRGEFRLLEGIWEGASFFIQRFIHVIEGMPSGEGYDDIRESVYAMLYLSDMVCDRAQLVRYQTGHDIGLRELPRKIGKQARVLRKLVRFSEAECKNAGISRRHLAPFVFDPTDRDGLLRFEFGQTSLERRPLASQTETDFYLLLPTACSLAIRRFVIERMDAALMRASFSSALGQEYARYLRGMRLFDGPKTPAFAFDPAKGDCVASFIRQIDEGYFLQLVVIIDDLENFERTGFATSIEPSPSTDKEIDRLVRDAQERVCGGRDFRGGITIVVGCGVGRSRAISFCDFAPRNWHVEFLPAHDLETLSWLRDFTTFSLWKILDARKRAEGAGANLHNINGLLNLVAWSRSLDGHLVPHGQLEDDSVAEGRSILIFINQNGLLSLRKEVAQGWDAHVEKDPSGNWVNVRREAQTIPEEQLENKLYATEDWPPRLIYAAPLRGWWCEVVSPPSGELSYDRWKMVAIWLERAAPVLDKTFVGLPPGPVLWRAVFDGSLERSADDHETIDLAKALSEITVAVDRNPTCITTHASKEYERSHLNVENVAERALVDTLVRGVAQLAGRSISPDELRDIVDSIIPNSYARQLHAFRQTTFRDHVRGRLPKKVIFIDREDDASSRLGLGWRARERTEGARVETKASCVDYLNRLVRSLEEELIGELHRLDRKTLIDLIIANMEAASADAKHWRQTSAATVALRMDPLQARRRLIEHQDKLNAVFVASRILLEAAICECPLEGGLKAGKLDIGRLLSIAASLFQFGGCSDAIRWDVMEPELRITPLGDVHANWNFLDDIVKPYLGAIASSRVEEDIATYDEYLQAPQNRPPGASSIDVRFLEAFKQQMGATFNHARLFVDYLEDLGFKSDSPVLGLSRSKLIEVTTDSGSVDEGSAACLVDNLTLKTRKSWRDIPDGFEERDRQPWRFRRRLTVLRRPLLQITAMTDDPILTFAPGMVRDALIYMVGNYLNGDLPDQQLCPLMLKWKGRVADERGRKFTNEVSSKLSELGWSVETEVRLTKFLSTGFDRDFGDIDVLAWRPNTKRVLIIECKDLQYKKTYGEICEQLADFRGGLRPNGKPDLLLKHLNRIDVISANISRASKYVGIPGLQQVESHLIFRHEVPMKFGLKRLEEKVKVHVFSVLSEI